MLDICTIYVCCKIHVYKMFWTIFFKIFVSSSFIFLLNFEFNVYADDHEKNRRRKIVYKY